MKKKGLVKKIAAVGIATSMAIASAVTASAATTYTEVLNFDFSNADGLKSFTAFWDGDDKCNATTSETTHIADGAFTTSQNALVATNTFDGSKGFVIEIKAKFDFTKIGSNGGDIWYEGIVNAMNLKGYKDDFMALDGSVAVDKFQFIGLNLQGGGKSFQPHAFDTVNNDGHIFGGNLADFEDDGAYHTAVYTVLPGTDALDVSLEIDGVAVDIPNGDAKNMNTVKNDVLSDTMALIIGGCSYGNYANNVTVDSVKVSVPTEAGDDAKTDDTKKDDAKNDAGTKTDAPKTGDVFTVIPVMILAAAATVAFVAKKKAFTE